MSMAVCAVFTWGNTVAVDACKRPPDAEVGDWRSEVEVDTRAMDPVTSAGAYTPHGSTWTGATAVSQTCLATDANRIGNKQRTRVRRDMGHVPKVYSAYSKAQSLCVFFEKPLTHMLTHH